MEKLLKFNGKIVCGIIKSAYIESIITEDDEGRFIIRRNLMIEMYDAPSLCVYTNASGVICGSPEDEEDDDIMFELIHVLFHNDKVDFDACATLN